jgi:Leucine-rich repeat (LRR) protein
LELLSIENTGVSDLDPLRNLNRLKIVFADNSKITLQEANDFTDENPETLVIFQTYENNTWWKALSPAWQDIMMAQLNFQGVPDRMKLQQIANLDKVIINENMSVSDLTPLTYLSRLKELQFTGTSVAQLDPVGKMTKLQALRCSKNPILSLEPLRSLHFLKELDISNTSVEDLTPLQGLEQLEILKFSGTPVKKLKPIQGLTNLRIVEFYNTKISGLDELDAMRKLEMLKIFNTKISSKRVDKFKAAHPGCEVVYY